MKRLIFWLFFVFSFLVFLPQNLFAETSGFNTSSVVRYTVDDKGRTTVTHDITLENALTDLYATSYTLTLEGVKPLNPRANQGSTNLIVNATEEDSKTILKVTFPDAVVGKGQKRNFALSYDDNSLAVKTGEVWEITIPRLSGGESFQNYSVVLSVPSVFGNPAYVSPDPTQRTIDEGRNILTFEKDAISKSGITAAFGQFQVFSFNLIYHLENPLNVGADIDIAIPPDTAYQKVNYTNLDPKPANVYVDEDGNWLAKFRLKPRERVDVKAEGAVQLFASPRKFIIPSINQINSSKAETEVWQTTDLQIRELARRLKTPRAIYNYVVSTLSYDYERVKPNVERLGAVEALRNPKNAICTEFTDLFIAIARAAGIPAREINGYAYTENPQIQPLSLVSDVLHAWPEYWDERKQVWVPIDPTWGSTTGTLDYFSKLDLRHFTFVIHGKDAKKPYPPGSYKLGPNPQKDVFVSFGQLPNLRASTPKAEIAIERELPLADMMAKVLVRNDGPTALYNQAVDIFFDGKIVKKENIEILPPYGTYEIPLTVPFSFIGRETPSKITVTVGSEKVEAPTYKPAVIIASTALILSLILGILAIIYVKFLRKKFPIVNEKLTSLKSVVKKPTS